MVHSQLQLFKKGKLFDTFDVVHNLDEYQMDIDNAFQNWLLRTDDFGIDNFMRYVVSKDIGNIICITKKRYDELLKEYNSEKVTEKIREKYQ